MAHRLKFANVLQTRLRASYWGASVAFPLTRPLILGFEPRDFGLKLSETSLAALLSACLMFSVA
jgi:hypothetical protein